MKKKDDQVLTTAEEEVEKKPKKGKRIANIVINVILVIAIVIAAVATYISFVSSSGNGVPSIFGRAMLSIQTESMYPTLEPGDLIIDKTVKNPEELKVGDIITYWTVIDGERALNTHRIYEIYDGGDYLIFSTKGDNNPTEDPLTVHESEIVGRYSTQNEKGEDVGGTRLKGVGKVFDFLQTSTGFLVVVVIPVALFFIYHLIQFFRVLFEYQSVKNRLSFEQEREENGEGEEDKEKLDELKKEEREKLEAELRERLKKELLESGAIAGAAEEKSEAEKAAEEAAKAAAEREKLEAEIRAKIMSELADKEKAPAEAVEKAAEEAGEAVEEAAKEAGEAVEKAEDAVEEAVDTAEKETTDAE